MNAISTFNLRSMDLLTLFVLIVVLLASVRGITASDEDFDDSEDHWEDTAHEMKVMIVFGATPDKETRRLSHSD